MLHFTERGFGLFTSRKMDRCCELYDLFQGCVCASCCVRWRPGDKRPWSTWSNHRAASQPSTTTRWERRRPWSTWSNHRAASLPFTTTWWERLETLVDMVKPQDHFSALHHHQVRATRAASQPSNTIRSLQRLCLWCIVMKIFVVEGHMDQETKSTTIAMIVLLMIWWGTCYVSLVAVKGQIV